MKSSKSKIMVPLVLQNEACECGAASLSMIMGYYGRYEKLIDVRNACNVSKDGCSMFDIVSAAEKYGMKASAYNCPPTLNNAVFPCIGFWEGKHFVVIEGISGGSDNDPNSGTVYVADPAIGHVEYAEEEFAKHFSFFIINFELTESFVKQGEPFSNVAFLRKLFAGKEKLIVYFGIIALISYAVGIVITKIEELYIDKIVESLNSTGIGQYFGIFLNVLVIQIAVLVFQLHMQLKLERLEAASVTQNVYKKLFRLPFDYFQKRSHATLESKLTNINSFTDFLSSKLITALFQTVFSVIYIGMIFYYSPLMAVLVIVAVAIIIMLLSLKMGSYKNESVSMKNEMARFYTTVSQNIQLFDTIKATAGEDDAMRTAMDDYYNYENVTQKTKKTMSIIQSVPLVAPMFLQIVVLLVGVYLCNNGKMTIGAVVASQSLTVLLYNSINTFVNSWYNFQNQVNTISVLDDIDNEPVDPMVIRDNCTNVAELEGKVELRNVIFGYSTNTPIIKGISFEINPGESVAIVGSSGSGKTTTLQLIEGLYIPWSGEVLFDGLSLKDTDRDDVADAVTIVSQKATIICGTVNDNITLLNSDITTDDIVRASKDACIYDDIMKKEKGFKEYLDPLSIQFSGGQIQRIMIARALVRNPKVLILDEATSALDTVVEEEVMNNIKKRGITTIIVAHRLSTIRDSSKIIVLDKGSVVEQGTHEELLRIENGLYRNLVASGDNNINE